MDNEDEGLILGQKFKILKKIGSGSFGYIYVCNFCPTRRWESRQEIKICRQNSNVISYPQEKKEKGDGQLQYEIKLYQTFQGIGTILLM